MIRGVRERVEWVIAKSYCKPNNVLKGPRPLMAYFSRLSAQIAPRVVKGRRRRTLVCRRQMSDVVLLLVFISSMIVTKNGAWVLGFTVGDGRNVDCGRCSRQREGEPAAG